MNKLDLKRKILFVLFSLFLIISSVLFNLEKIVLAVIFFVIALVFIFLLVSIKKDK